MSSDVWMGSGLTMTMAPESKLFLGYMPYGPTLGRVSSNKAHLIKYSLGYAVDGASVLIENTDGENSNDVKHFTDYYHLVPDLYTGCIAEFYTKSDELDSYALEFTAMVAGNDADAIYFAGNLADFPTLYVDTDVAVSSSRKRGYICLQQHGAVVPAPISLEKRNSADTNTFSADNPHLIADSGTDGSVENLKIGDLLYTDDQVLIGKVWGFSVDSTALTKDNYPEEHDGTTTDDTIHILSDTLGTLAGASTQANGIGTITVPTDLTGYLTAGDYISNHASARASAEILGKVITLSSDGLTVTYAQSGSATASGSDEIYWGRRVPNVVSSETAIYTVSPKILSNNWLGLVDSATPATAEITVEQKNLALGGSRNFTYQYKGMETPGSASLDVTLNHGTWLHYALGTCSLSSSTPSTHNGTNAFQVADSVDSTGHNVYVGITTDVDDYNTTGHTSDTNGKIHRVLKGTQTLCPPLLPFTAAGKITLPSVNASTKLIENAITYTFSERNDSTLPSFAFELVAEKAANLESSPMVDRGTTSRQDGTTFDTKDNVYAQIHPGATMENFTLTAAADSAATANMSFNIKRTFECPTGYVGRAYDATNNDTSAANLPRVLNNFGQNTGVSTAVKQEFLTPYYFSDGTVSLFGSEFMKVSNFSLTIDNGVTPKRYVGQYNKQIQNVVTGQRTYNIEVTALVSDRRLFAELRNEDSFRSAMSNSNVQLLLEKSTGERIKLQFDDFMVSVANFPGPTDDRGPLEVTFSIMPIRKGTTIDTKTSWVMQG